ncbi:MAG: hypothetical protein A2Y73_00140 [Chloroflexi bacterium RBG_13_56_8]|nr:MAG: hypothetical protein A2Y73_00140 [Chloroflexi bacterium RBG_13_56_8]
MSFTQILAQKRDIVWREIESYLGALTDYPPFCRIPDRYADLAALHQQIVSEYPSRKGKYVRPALLLLTAAAMGCPEEMAIKTAAAMQISEDWLLCHDDVEDDSLLRRGGPTLHRVYGKELAINAGDALHVLQWKVLADNLQVLGEQKSWAIMDEFYRILSRTALGQMVEIKWTKDNRLDLTDEDILFILESKTGYYTIGGPMRLGAILAGANEGQLAKLYAFGRALGQCYQIKDDLLDLAVPPSSQEQLADHDIYEGKRTVMLMHVLRTAQGEEREHLLAILDKPREARTNDDVTAMLAAMRKHGSLAHAENLAKELASEAKRIFHAELGFLSHQPARDQLLAAVDYVWERTH